MNFAYIKRTVIYPNGIDDPIYLGKYNKKTNMLFPNIEGFEI